MKARWEIWHDGAWLLDVYACNGLQALMEAVRLGFYVDGLEAYPT